MSVQMEWEQVDGIGEAGPGTGQICRAKVPGGWLIFVDCGYGGGSGLTFLPDPQHTWDEEQN